MNTNNNNKDNNRQAPHPPYDCRTHERARQWQTWADSASTRDLLDALHGSGESWLSTPADACNNALVARGYMLIGATPASARIEQASADIAVMQDQPGQQRERDQTIPLSLLRPSPVQQRTQQQQQQQQHIAHLAQAIINSDLSLEMGRDIGHIVGMLIGILSGDITMLFSHNDPLLNIPPDTIVLARQSIVVDSIALQKFIGELVQAVLEHGIDETRAVIARWQEKIAQWHLAGDALLAAMDEEDEEDEEEASE